MMDLELDPLLLFSNVSFRVYIQIWFYPLWGSFPNNRYLSVVMFVSKYRVFDNYLNF